MIDEKTCIERLRTWGFTEDEIAKASGVSLSTINRIIRGRRKKVRRDTQLALLGAVDTLKKEKAAWDARRSQALEALGQEGAS